MGSPDLVDVELATAAVLGSRMQLLLFMLLLLVLVTVTQSSSGPCVNSCCQHCDRPEHCRVCYLLNSNPVMCPCINTINSLHSGGGQKTFARQVIGANYREYDNAEDTDYDDTDDNDDLTEEYDDNEVATERLIERYQAGRCFPACCRDRACTRDTCPLCFRRAETSPRTCPCSF